MMRRAMAKVFVALFVLTSAGAMLSACNTTRGVGEDMQAGGHALSNSAEKNQ
ncbi:MAG TPA: entericidin A/B family lipoprotein [Stellaceae bacterium]|nr:entericidin A/B family lipoprotein [Stellaceae bacterium]